MDFSTFLQGRIIKIVPRKMEAGLDYCSLIHTRAEWPQVIYDIYIVYSLAWRSLE